MKTPQEYLNKKLPIIPCEGKMPIVKAWQDREFQLEDFKPGNNIGLKMKKYFDKIKFELEELKIYDIEVKVMNTEDHGVPQHRR